MNTLLVRIATDDEIFTRILEAERRVLAGDETFKATPSYNFPSYDDMYRTLSPSRLAIITTLAGQGALSIREVARRVGRDVQAVHRDVTMLIKIGMIDRTDKGVEFPYTRIHFEYDVEAAA
ncbi:winged helix-turn-helix transcriptional regulator [Phyllobacterium leguminum]|uniref:Putative transcriptional regulator n=1 Tax=Phyllobacterium leguminum TaxID=314237 RepID=A0A318T4P8_9HYPH|nr:winged helix-turn-helix transcriptional regulator [Phyllobacterium leguminum]PYE89990.1 putative transcriptional regulator [Phyllobacterium leguminum]